MSHPGRLIAAVGLVAGSSLILVALYVATDSTPAQVAPRPPELGGQQVPAKVYRIPFDRTYDLFCEFSGTERAFRGCKVLGFTGEEAGDSRAGPSSGFGGFSSSSGSRSAYNESKYFDHWVVLEFSDGRLAYIPKGAIRYIEEASPAGP